MIDRDITTDVSLAARYIREGRIVAFPTGTSYGLAVSALQGHALQRLKNLKKRPREKSFTVFVAQDLVDTYFTVTSEEKETLEKYPTSALTILLEPKEELAHLAQDGRVGLRVMDHPLMEALAEETRIPLTATSANISGMSSCFTPECINEQFPFLVFANEDEKKHTKNTTYDLSLACILDGGILPEGKMSTIVQFKEGRLEIIRQGSQKL